MIRREFAVPDDIELALLQRAPQALLRDLHRPVVQFQVTALDFVPEPKIRADAGVETTSENRRAFLASYRVPIGELLHTSADMRREYLELKAVIARPWTDAPKMASMRLRG